MLQHFVEMSSICHASCISCTSQFFSIGALQTPSTCWFGLISTSPLKGPIVESIFLKGINPTTNWFFPPLQKYRSNSEVFFLFNLDSDCAHQTDLVLVMKYCCYSWLSRLKKVVAFLSQPWRDLLLDIFQVIISWSSNVIFFVCVFCGKMQNRFRGLILEFLDWSSPVFAAMFHFFS